MGIFSFIKNEGVDILDGHKISEELDFEAKINLRLKAAGEEIEAESEAAQKFEKIIRNFQFEVEKLKVVVDDDQVTVKGKAKDQCSKEKIVLILGNIKGIATVDDQMSVDHEVLESKFHTVAKDDNLNKIAQHYYGNANKFIKVLEANMPMLKTSDSIYPGQVLRIPYLD